MSATSSPMQPGDYIPSLLSAAGTQWLLSEKYDGWRCLKMKDGSFMSRNGKPLNPPAHITDAIAAMGLPAGAMLDGELWMGRGKLQHVTGAIASANPALQYVLFDYPSAPGGYHERLQLLRTHAAKAALSQVAVVETHEVAGGSGALAAVDAFFDKVVSQPHAEGIVIAPRDQPYHWGLRPTSFMKRKRQEDMEVRVVGHHITAAAKKNDQDGYVSSLECCLLHAPATQFKVSYKTTGAPPVGAIVTIVYRGLTAAGVPRHANFKAVREDADMPPASDDAPAAEAPQSLYDVLGVAPTCSVRDLKAGYKAALLKHHPDKGGDATMFKAVQDAYEVLGKKESRDEYDRTGALASGDAQPMVGVRVPAKRGGKRKTEAAAAPEAPAAKKGKAAKGKAAAAPPPPPAPSSTELAPALGMYTMEQLAEVGGVQLEANQYVKVQGSKASSVYEVRRPADGGPLYCTCPAWRLQKGMPAAMRTCKHCNAVAGLGLPAGKAGKKLR